MNGRDTYYRIELAEELSDCGALNPQSLSKVRAILASEATGTDAGVLLVDMRHVIVPSAELVGLIVEADVRLRTPGRCLKICNARPAVRDVLGICKLESFLANEPVSQL